MRINPGITNRIALLVTVMLSLTLLSSHLRADTGTCGGASITLPFTDVPNTNVFFCSIAEAYFSGLTNGTTATTYSPGDPVPREQMAAFVTRTMDQSLKRGSRRAALKQFWTPSSTDGLGFTNVGDRPLLVVSDGADLWVANQISGTVSRVQGSDGTLLQTWTDAIGATGVLSAKGQVFITGLTNPGSLYQIDPTMTAGPVTALSNALGGNPGGIAFDGARVWTANNAGSVSIVTLNPLGVVNVTAGFSFPVGILFDGSNMWVTDEGTPGRLFKLDSNGAIIQTVMVGSAPLYPTFDGTNIWVPNAQSNSVTVVRASTGDVIATLTANGLQAPFAAAFDGERILVTNNNNWTVSLWKAADLNPLGSVGTGSNSFPYGACSDGLNFWITLSNTNKLARF